MPSFPRRDFLKALGVSVAAACGSLRASSAIADPHPMPDVVVLLPGILGSVLQKDGRDVWSLSGQGLAGALASLGGNIRALKLADDPPEADDLGDGVTATRLMPDAHLIPGLWKVDGYSALRRWILDTFSVREGENYFEFPYDWRRDNRVAARRLARMSRAWLGNWRERSGNNSARLVLIAHSMGGLVSRHYIEVLEGWKDTRVLITFGTPYRGSVKAVNFLCNGMEKSIGPLKVVDLGDLLRSFTSVYQLLPIYPCYDAGEGTLVRVGETTGIPNIDPQRAAQALRFHRGIESAVDANGKIDAYVRDRYRIYPIVGTFQPTLQAAKRVGGQVQAATSFPGPNSRLAFDGDGTVPRVSATPIEARDDVTPFFVAEQHGSLQNTRGSLIQVEGLLAPRAAPGSFRDLELPRVALALDDAVAAGEPIPLTIACEDQSLDLEVIVGNADSGVEVARQAVPGGTDPTRKATLAKLPAGTYRIEVGARGRSQRVTDIFIALG